MNGHGGRHYQQQQQHYHQQQQMQQQQQYHQGEHLPPPVMVSPPPPPRPAPLPPDPGMRAIRTAFFWSRIMSQCNTMQICVQTLLS